jgi:ribosome-associated heat shock protein Hsp15
VSEPSGKIRLDKWLWFARVVKTRVIAQELAASGHVRINGQRAESASRSVRTGDVLTIALPSRVRVLKVLDTAERRGQPSEAVRLYEELANP